MNLNGNNGNKIIEGVIMKVEFRVYDLKDGNWYVALKTKRTMNKLDTMKQIRKWYKHHPYAKMIDENTICGDYRIDQQRPQRNVRSDGYIKILSITDMEKRYLKKLIDELEKQIEYPTLWDNGEEVFYEETIYCPKCGERRKVLTSETHCEFCGFEFSKAKKCPICNTLNLKGSKSCKKCDYEFRNESFIKNDDFEVKKNDENNVVKCPKCNGRKSQYFDKCQNCGFDFNGKKECPICHHWVDEKDKFCCHCGQELIVLLECSNCGKKNNSKNNFCSGCGVRLM